MSGNLQKLKLNFFLKGSVNLVKQSARLYMKAFCRKHRQMFWFSKCHLRLTKSPDMHVQRQRDDSNPCVCVCVCVCVYVCFSFFSERKSACVFFICMCVYLHSNCHQLLFQFDVCRIWMKLIFLFIIFHWWLSSSVCPHRILFPGGRCLCVCWIWSAPASLAVSNNHSFLLSENKKQFQYIR